MRRPTLILFAILSIALSRSSTLYAQVDTVRVAPGSQILLIIEEGPPPTPDTLPNPLPFEVTVDENGSDSVVVRAEGFAVPGADVSYAFLGTYVASRWDRAVVVDGTTFESRQSRTFAADSVRRYLTVRSLRMGQFSPGEETVYFYVRKYVPPDTIPPDTIPPPDTVPPPPEPPLRPISGKTTTIDLGELSATLTATLLDPVPGADSIHWIGYPAGELGGPETIERRTAAADLEESFVFARRDTTFRPRLRWSGINEAGEGPFRDDAFGDVLALEPAPPDTTPPPPTGPDPISSASNVTAPRILPGAEVVPLEGTLILRYDTRGPAGLWSRDNNGYGEGGHFSSWLTRGDTLRVRIQSTDASYEVRTPNAGGNRRVVVLFGLTGGLRVYLDGELVGSNPYAGGLCCTVQDIGVGVLLWSSLPGTVEPQEFPISAVGGTVLDARLYDEVLPDSAIVGWVPPIPPDTIPPDTIPPDPVACNPEGAPYNGSREVLLVSWVRHAFDGCLSETTYYRPVVGDVVFPPCGDHGGSWSYSAEGWGCLDGTFRSASAGVTRTLKAGDATGLPEVGAWGRSYGVYSRTIRPPPDWGPGETLRYDPPREL